MKQRVELSAEDIAKIIRDTLKAPEATVKFVVDVGGGELRDVIAVVDNEAVPKAEPDATTSVVLSKQVSPA